MKSIALTLAAVLLAGPASAAETVRLRLNSLKAIDGYEIIKKDGYITTRALEPAPGKVPVYINLPTDLEKKFAGKTITVEVSARAFDRKSDVPFQVTYFTLSNGNSGLKEMTAAKDYSTQTFDYLVPEMKGEPDKDMLGFFVTDPIDIQRIRITVR